MNFPESMENGPEIIFPMPRGNLLQIKLRFKINKDELVILKKVVELAELSFLDDSQVSVKIQ